MLEAWWLWPVLFLSGLVAGWVDSIAGGLITIPVLLVGVARLVWQNVAGK